MLISRSRSHRLSWRTRFATAAVAAVMLTSAAAAHADARGPIEPALAVVGGVCAIAGTVTETFSPAVQATPTTVKATFTGTGTCVGSSGADQITVSYTTNALLSCAGGEGTLAGYSTFASGFPPLGTGTGLYIGAPGSFAFEVTGPNLTVTGALAWSPTATALCPLSGTSSTPLYGTVVYLYD